MGGHVGVGTALAPCRFAVCKGECASCEPKGCPDAWSLTDLPEDDPAAYKTTRVYSKMFWAMHACTPPPHYNGTCDQLGCFALLSKEGLTQNTSFVTAPGNYHP